MYRRRLLLLVVHVTFLSLVSVVDANSDAKRLYDDLIMKNYNKHCRPVEKFADITVVKLGLGLSQIVNVDEVNQILTVNLWVEQEWTDTRFYWDPKQYNNITKLHVPMEKIWLPDIVLYNNADGDYTVTTVSKAIITPDGKVTWKPPMQFKSSCTMDVEYFPFDEQKCSMKFGPWTHDTSKVDIDHKMQSQSVLNEDGTVDMAFGMDEYQPSVEWDVMEATAKKNLIYYTCCAIPYADVTFNITLKRRTLYYLYNLVIPQLSIMVLTCLSFYLPSYSGEKISITISVYLSLSIFQLLLMELVPSTSLRLPLIGKHIMAILSLSTLSIIFNTWVLRINYRTTTTHEMSDWTRWLFLGILPRLLRMYNPMNPVQNNAKTSRSHETPHRNDVSRYYEKRLNSRRKSHVPLLHHVGPPSFQNTSFLGINRNTLNLDRVCNACVKRRMKMYPPTVQKGFDSGCFIAKHYSDEDDAATALDEWRYVALVLDRILLWVYIIISLVTAVVMFLKAPALYDTRTPLTATTAPVTIVNITSRP